MTHAHVRLGSEFVDGVYVRFAMKMSDLLINPQMMYIYICPVCDNVHLVNELTDNASFQNEDVGSVIYRSHFVMN